MVAYLSGVNYVNRDYLAVLDKKSIKGGIGIPPMSGNKPNATQ
jgi:hypothetical protein